MNCLPVEPAIANRRRLRGAGTGQPHVPKREGAINVLERCGVGSRGNHVGAVRFSFDCPSTRDQVWKVGGVRHCTPYHLELEKVDHDDLHKMRVSMVGSPGKSTRMQTSADLSRTP